MPRTLPLILALFLLPLTARAATISLADYGAKPDSNQDAAPALQAAIAEAARHPEPVTINIPKGRYDFFPEHASHRTFFASNAGDTDGKHVIGVDLKGLKNLTIEGNGALFMMRGKMTLLVADECENLNIHNLAFDFLRPTMSEVKISETGDDYWIGQVHPDSKYELKDGKYVVWLGEGWKTRHNLGQIFDPGNNTTWRLNFDPINDATAVEEVHPGVLKFTVSKAVEAKIAKELKVGETLQCRDVRRDEVGMWINHSKNVTLKDVTVRYMHGFGILGQFSEDITVDHLTVAPTKESGRTCAAFADILHFSMCRGKIIVRDSLLSAAHDDAINVHGVYFKVIAAPAPNQIRVRFPHGQTWGFQGFFKGDEIAFTRKKSLEQYADNKIAAVEIINPHEQLLTLEKAAPADVVLNEDCIENTTWTPSLEVRNCDVSAIPTRGFLITTRRPVLIEDNRFNRIHSQAIVISNDAAGWYESGPTRDVTIRNNHFLHDGEAVIAVDNAFHSGLKILNNEFILDDHLALSAIHVKGITFSGNTIKAAKPQPNARLHSITDHSTDVVFENNTIERLSP